jgi:phage gp36-like protein
MGDYTKPNDMRRLYSKIDTADLETEDLEFFVLKAESEINGKLAIMYSVPISPAPQLLRQLSTELAIVYVLEQFFTSEQRSENDWIGLRKKAVLQMLQDIVDGNMALIDESGGVISTDVGDITSTTVNYESTFTHLPAEDERVDPDRLDDEMNERDL